MRRPLDSYNLISSRHGQVTNMGLYGRHLGVDYARPVGGIVKAPTSGLIIDSYYSATIGNTIEMRADDGKIHRFLHLSVRSVRIGVRVAEGQQIGVSGATGSNLTGPHLHWDVRRGGTAWNDSFANFYDPEALVAASSPGISFNMPAVGKVIQLIPTVTRNTFRAGTTTVAGTIRATDSSYVYTVRGYDPRYPNRVLINSVAGGGNGVALALYLTNGQVISNWKVKE